jgi:DNA polymerase-3 subunit gamma/tau
VELIGSTDARVLNEVVAAITTQDAAALFSVVEGVIESGHEPRRFATDVLDRLRDLLVIQAIPDAADRGVVEVPVEIVEDLQAQAAGLGHAELTRAAELVNEGLSSLRGATAPRLTLEILCARLVLPAVGGTNLDLLARVDHLERRLGELSAMGVAPAVVGVPPAAMPAPADSPATVGEADATQAAGARSTRVGSTRDGSAGGGPARSGPRRISDIAPSTRRTRASSDPAPGSDQHPDLGHGPAQSAGLTESGGSTAPGAPPTVTLEQVQALWPAVVEAVKMRSRVAWMTVQKSSPVSASDATVVAVVADAGAAAHFKKTAYPELVAEAMLEVLKSSLRFELIHDPGRAAAGAEAADALTGSSGAGQSVRVSPAQARSMRQARRGTGRSRPERGGRPAAGESGAGQSREDRPQRRG